MQRRVAAFALALVLASPLVAASWRGVGTHEPDSSEDAARGRMFEEPDERATGRRVYFDAFATTGGPAEGTPTDGASVNPNVGALGTRIALAGLVEYRALLGVWRDCNQDGYIGQAEGALQEYRAELLPNRDTCPPDSQHNDGMWVSEFLFLGMTDPCEHKDDAPYREANCPSTHYGPLPNSDSGSVVPAFVKNVRVIYLNGTFVWGDLGAPGATPPPACALRPAPRGTTASTGGLLRFSDCQVGFAVANTANAATSAMDPQNELGLRFEDPEHPERSSSALNQRFPASAFGDPSTGSVGLLQRDSGRPMARAWDCDAPPRADARDPTGGDASEVVLTDPTGGALTGPKIIPVVGTRTVFRDDDKNPATPGVFRARIADEDGSYATVPHPAPSQIDSGGSAWDAAESAADGPVPTGDCDEATDSALRGAYVGGMIESDAAAASGARTQPSFTMWFYDGYRGFQSGDPYLGTHTAPSDGGLVYGRNVYGGAMWSATASTPADPQLVDRYHAQPEGARVVSFYARIPPEGVSQLQLELPTYASGTYGFEACGAAIGEGAPERNGWACDPALWWRAPDGSDVTPRFAEGEVAFGQRVGAPYDLLDVDCYDGKLTDDVYASLASFQAVC